MALEMFGPLSLSLSPPPEQKGQTNTEREREKEREGKQTKRPTISLFHISTKVSRFCGRPWSTQTHNGRKEPKECERESNKMRNRNGWRMGER